MCIAKGTLCVFVLLTLTFSAANGVENVGLLASKSLDHLNELKRKYDAQNSTFWGQRGRAWLFVQQGLLLGASNLHELSGGRVGTERRLTIVEVNRRPCNARRVVIWVRFSGPEIIAGLATPRADNACSWFFDFTPTVPGAAQLDMKLMSYDPRPRIDYPLDLHLNSCSNGDFGGVVVDENSMLLVDKRARKRRRRRLLDETEMETETETGVVKKARHLFWTASKWVSSIVASGDADRVLTAAAPSIRTHTFEMERLHTMDVRSELVDFVVVGKKFYSPELSCCAACARRNANADPRARCTHWAHGNPGDRVKGNVRTVDTKKTGGSSFTRREMAGVAKLLSEQIAEADHAAGESSENGQTRTPRVESLALQKWRRLQAAVWKDDVVSKSAQNAARVETEKGRKEKLVEEYTDGIRCLLFNRANREDSKDDTARNGPSALHTEAVGPISTTTTITMTGVSPSAQQSDKIFLGCGWSFSLSYSEPCLDGGRDDLIFGSGEMVLFEEEDAVVTEMVLDSLAAEHDLSAPSPLPTCSLGVTASGGAHHHLHDYRDGRWVRLPHDNLCQFAATTRLVVNIPAGELYISSLHVPVHSYSKGVLTWDHWGVPPEGAPRVQTCATPMPITRFVPGQPGVCWFGDQLHRIGERQPEGRSYVNEWRSPYGRKAAPPLFAYWAPSSCRIVIHDEESRLNACLARRGVRMITVHGTSIAKYTSNYVTQRLLAIGWNCALQWPKPALSQQCFAPNWRDDESTIPPISAVLSTLGSPHLLWGGSNAAWEAKLLSTYGKLRKEMIVPPNPAKSQRGFTMKRVVAWGFGPFISSERESHVTLTRMIEFGAVARRILPEWREIDWFGPSAAFAFDSSTQGDGLHITGAPQKLFVELFFGSLCEDEAGFSTY